MSRALECQRLELPEDGLLVVGFSGGADSTALAHWLMGRAEKGRILLAHVNHMLRGDEADSDQAAAERFAREQGLRIEVLRADVRALAREQGLGLARRSAAGRYGMSSFTGLPRGITTAYSPPITPTTTPRPCC